MACSALTIHLYDGVGDLYALVCSNDKSKHVRITGRARFQQETAAPVLDAIARDIWESLLEAVVLAARVSSGRSGLEGAAWA